MLMGIIIIRNWGFYRLASMSQSPQFKDARACWLNVHWSQSHQREKLLANCNDNDYHLYCSDRFLSLGRMTLPFCEHNRELLIRALVAMGLPAKRGGSLLAPPVRRQTPDWLGLFPRMTVPWTNSTVFATPPWQSLLPHLPSGS